MYLTDRNTDIDLDKFRTHKTWVAKVNDQECIAEKCAEQERERRNLPPGTPVPVMIVCRCPKCNPFIW